MPRLPAILSLAHAIADDDRASVARMLREHPSLATARIEEGATRRSSSPYFLVPIRHHVYAGDTALHVAAAAHRSALVLELLSLGADARARNRRGAEPLHYAADAAPGASGWNPEAQALTIAHLVAAGADPNALDASKVGPLHRAVRTRGAAAVRALLDGGADAHLTNGNGSTPMQLATRATGHSGAGSPESKAEQRAILALLERAG